jgi:hypothetical protein
MAIADRFIFAYGFFAVFGIWSICCWFSSDSLAKKQSGIEKLRKKAEKSNAKPKAIKEYESARKIHLLCFKVGVPGALIVLTGMCFLEVQSMQTEYRLHLPFGVLIPANDQTPPNACDSAPLNALRILLGPMGAFGTSFPQRVIKLNDDPILSFDRDAQGNISVSTDIYDRNGDIVVEIKGNHFRVANDAFEIIHPDFSSLAVIVRQNKERVLDIRYLNPRSIRVLGTFRHPNDPVLEVRQDSLALNGNPLSWTNVCVGDSGGADFAFGNH